ncbi:GFA family protein [Albidovulum sp.]|jgi:hypothetical protein|uniref:GFA family protein n=1 Tax=Albidovulum sp. TaxID=1872424 RepID=UPI00306A28AC
MTRYTGGCQCGAVRYEVDCSLDDPVACNCSRCQKLGSVLVFAPRAAFRLLTDEAALAEYRFNRKVIRHLFCRTCGIESFAWGEMPDGTQMVAVNVNCLDGVEPRSLSPRLVDGRSF